MWISRDSVETTLPTRLWVDKPKATNRYGGTVFDSRRECGQTVFERTLIVSILGREIEPGECVEVITSEVVG